MAWIGTEISEWSFKKFVSEARQKYPGGPAKYKIDSILVDDGVFVWSFYWRAALAHYLLGFCLSMSLFPGSIAVIPFAIFKEVKDKGCWWPKKITDILEWVMGSLSADAIKVFVVLIIWRGFEWI